MKNVLTTSILMMLALASMGLQAEELNHRSQVYAGGDTIYCPGPYICFTSDEWAYYNSVWQLYDDYSFCYHFGELGHIPVNDTLRELFFDNYEEGEWYTPYDGYTYSDTIRSMVFNANAGDTIQFWHDCELIFKAGVDAYEEIEFSDTLEFVIDLVSSSTDNTILTLQTTRLYPADSIGTLMVDVIGRWYDTYGFVGPDGSGQPDSTKELLLRRVVPDDVDNESVYIRLTPVFYGDYNDRGLWCVHRGMDRRSMAMESIGEAFKAVYDSIAQSDTLSRSLSINLVNNMLSVGGLIVWPNPARDELQVSLKGNKSATSLIIIGATDGVLYMNYELKGTEGGVCNVDVSSLNPGQYFLALMNRDKFLSYKLVVIKKEEK